VLQSPPKEKGEKWGFGTIREWKRLIHKIKNEKQIKKRRNAEGFLGLFF
jgi:hypothetical protein